MPRRRRPKAPEFKYGHGIRLDRYDETIHTLDKTFGYGRDAGHTYRTLCGKNVYYDDFSYSTDGRACPQCKAKLEALRDRYIFQLHQLEGIDDALFNSDYNEDDLEPVAESQTQVRADYGVVSGGGSSIALVHTEDEFGTAPALDWTAIMHQYQSFDSTMEND